MGQKISLIKPKCCITDEEIANYAKIGVHFIKNKRSVEIFCLPPI